MTKKSVKVQSYDCNDRRNIITRACGLEAHALNIRVSKQTKRISIEQLANKLRSENCCSVQKRDVAMKILRLISYMTTEFSNHQVMVKYDQISLCKLEKLFAADRRSDMDMITSFLLHWCGEKIGDDVFSPHIAIMSATDGGKVTLNLTLAIQLAIQIAVVSESYDLIHKCYGGFRTAIDQCGDDDVRVCENLITTHKQLTEYNAKHKIHNQVLSINCSVKRFLDGCWQKHRITRLNKQYEWERKRIKQLYYESAAAKEAIEKGCSLIEAIQELLSEMSKLCNIRDAAFGESEVQLADACLPDLDGITASLGYGALVNITDYDDWENILFDRNEPFLIAAHDLAAAIATICD